jgi:hypothetical protein
LHAQHEKPHVGFREMVKLRLEELPEDHGRDAVVGIPYRVPCLHNFANKGFSCGLGAGGSRQGRTGFADGFRVYSLGQQNSTNVITAGMVP